MLTYPYAAKKGSGLTLTHLSKSSAFVYENPGPLLRRRAFQLCQHLTKRTRRHPRVRRQFE